MKMGLEQMLALAVRRPQLQQVAPLPGWVNVTGDPGLLQKLSDLGHEDLGVNVWNGKMRDIAAARWLSFFKLVVRTCAELADERKLDRAQFMGDALRTLERRTAAASAYQLLGLGDLEDLDWVHPWTVPCYEPSSASRSELTEPK
ncbi:uncharacterized protein LOC127749762 [Frankliniella occidentalis]|uniref:Uncharacterized protein LOC127749762 n=1 Tax=Frankliniella occidentalis TaxID=133901 RepID=A0A9C6WZ43_FRAOC|nr:uncharacterized protein LOC127749762 [Frankliniella occidentalis]